MNNFALFASSILSRMKSIFYFIVLIIHPLETTFINDKTGTKFLNFKHLQMIGYIVALMNSSDYVVNKKMVNIISSCFDLKNNLLPNSMI